MDGFAEEAEALAIDDDVVVCGGVEGVSIERDFVCFDDGFIIGQLGVALGGDLVGGLIELDVIGAEFWEVF